MVQDTQANKAVLILILQGVVGEHGGWESSYPGCIKTVPSPDSGSQFIWIWILEVKTTSALLHSVSLNVPLRWQVIKHVKLWFYNKMLFKTTGGSMWLYLQKDCPQGGGGGGRCKKLFINFSNLLISHFVPVQDCYGKKRVLVHKCPCTEMP